MLQISRRSRVESSILQVAWVNIFAVPIYPCIFVGLRSFSRSHGKYCSEGGGSSRRITIEAGAAEIRRFYFCCNWEKGGSSGVSAGTAAPDSDIHFPFVLLSWLFEIFSKDPWLTCTQWARVYLHIFTITALAPPRYQSSAVCSTSGYRHSLPHPRTGTLQISQR